MSTNKLKEEEDESPLLLVSRLLYEVEEASNGLSNCYAVGKEKCDCLMWTCCKEEEEEEEEGIPFEHTSAIRQVNIEIKAVQAETAARPTRDEFNKALQQGK